MQPIIYKSTDAQAPQLTYEAGSMNTILKACLITGYGSKQSASWEIVHENQETQQLAIRSKNPKSPKHVLYMVDNSSDSATVTAYKAWDSTSTQGLQQYHTGYFVKKWDYHQPSWIILATDRFFYLFIHVKGGEIGFVMNGFGDLVMLRDNVENTTALLCSSGTSLDQSVFAHEDVKTSLGAALFPRLPYNSNDYNERYFGDKSFSNAGHSYFSDTVILSQFCLYLQLGNQHQPTCELPGMLLSWCGHNPKKVQDFIAFLDNQPPYQNPILGIWQQWTGRIWLHTDNWNYYDI